MSKEAMKMALEALRYPLDTSVKLFDADKAELMNIRAINALRKALEEPPEKYTFDAPLLDLFKVTPGQMVNADADADADAELRRLHAENEGRRESNEWLIRKCDELYKLNAELVEALKNANDLDADANVLAASSSALADSVDKLIAPTPRKPLTDEEIINIGKKACAVEGPHILPVSFAREIERAHGIGEQT